MSKGYLKQMPMLRGNMIQQVSVDLCRAYRTYLHTKKRVIVRIYSLNNLVVSNLLEEKKNAILFTS